MASKTTPEKLSDETQEQTPARAAVDTPALDETKVAALLGEFASTPARAATLRKYLEEGGTPADIANQYLLREHRGTTHARHFMARVAEVLG